MARSRITVTLDSHVRGELDRLVARAQLPSRSPAIEAALNETLGRLDGNRLSREVANLDPGEERTLAEEGMASLLASWRES